MMATKLRLKAFINIIIYIIITIISTTIATDPCYWLLNSIAFPYEQPL